MKWAICSLFSRFFLFFLVWTSAHVASFIFLFSTKWIKIAEYKREREEQDKLQIVVGVSSVKVFSHLLLVVYFPYADVCLLTGEIPGVVCIVVFCCCCCWIFTRLLFLRNCFCLCSVLDSK